MSIMKHLLVMFINNPGKQWTVDSLLGVPWVIEQNVKRGTIKEYLRRLHNQKLIDKLTLGRNKVAYRLRDLNKSNQYLNGTLDHLTPHPPAPLRPTTIRHRVTYLLQLSRDEIAQAKHIGKFHERKNSAGYYQVTTENFKMTVYLPKGKAEIFLFKEPDWYAEFEHMFGYELAFALNEQVLNKMGNSGLAHPVTIMGDKIYVDDCLVRIGRSQLPLEIDVHGPEAKAEGDIVPALWEDMRFRGLVINNLAAQKEQNESFSSVLNNMAITLSERNDEYGSELKQGITEIKQMLGNQPTKGDIGELRDALLKVARALEPLTKEENYATPAPKVRVYDPSYQ
jgi:hypothetical protein